MFRSPKVAKLEAKRDIKGLVRTLRCHRGNSQTSDELRRSAAEALGRIGVTAIPALTAALDSEEQGVPYYAALALGHVGTPAISILATALENDKWEAAHGLRLIGPTAIPALINGLRDPYRAVRFHVVEALTALRWRPTSDETGAAYWAQRGQWDECVKIGAPAIQALSNELDRAGSCRQLAMALGRIGAPAVPTLVQALDHRDWNVRVAAIEALGVNDVDVTERLLSLLQQDPSWPVRYAAADSLERLGQKTVVARTRESAEWQAQHRAEMAEADLRARQGEWDSKWGSYYVTDAMMASGTWEDPPPRPSL